LAPALSSNAARFGRLAAALCVISAAWQPSSATARDAHKSSESPFEVSGGQYEPVAWADIAGWAADDHLPALNAFRASCKPIAAQTKPSTDPKALGSSLRDPCRIARAAEISDNARARAFFEDNFLPMRISRIGEPEGFVTGYYEPILDGSRVKTDAYPVPVYRRPSNLFVRGQSQASTSMPNSGDVFRKIGRRKLVPYYDRGQIEDGAIAGRGLEIAWLKNQTDLLFTQIQGSARIRVADGGMIRINYDSHNGFRYTPVGRALIERNIIPREQMSMQRIRQWMEENPDGANELRRTNRSYVFFREVQLAADVEAVGAQGVPLTPGRSIAVDKGLHVYGTPFFIEGELPIETEISKTPFRRLMVAQDTGSAIVGPARADIYFGAGDEAGRVSGRIKQSARFVMLVPKSLDPVERGRGLPLPPARPSEHIAKLFPEDAAKPAPTETAKPVETAAVPIPLPSPVKETPPAKAPEKAADFIGPPAPTVAAPATVAAVAPVAVAIAAKAVPLPEARPVIAAEAKSESRKEAAKEVKKEARREARPRHRERRHLQRRAPRPSGFRFFWQ
jgi:membrane-bound lytic murein transglycosylase A